MYMDTYIHVHTCMQTSGMLYDLFYFKAEFLGSKMELVLLLY